MPPAGAERAPPEVVPRRVGHGGARRAASRVRAGRGLPARTTRRPSASAAPGRGGGARAPRAAAARSTPTRASPSGRARWRERPSRPSRRRASRRWSSTRRMRRAHEGLRAFARHDPAWARRAAAFAQKVQDVTEFLARAPLGGPLAPLPLTVTYHDPCHVAHGQKIRARPGPCCAPCPGSSWWSWPRPRGAAARRGSTT